MIPFRDVPDLARWRQANPAIAEVLKSSSRRCKCGERLRGHLKCKRCGVLAGKDHAQTRLYNGLCGTCLRDMAKKMQPPKELPRQGFRFPRLPFVGGR